MALAISMILHNPAIANQEWFDSSKPVSCGPFREIVQLVTNSDFREQPVWIGKSGTDATYFALFRNPETQTWTLVQYGTAVGCVLGMGKNDKTHNYDPAIQSPSNP